MGAARRVGVSIGSVLVALFALVGSGCSGEDDAAPARAPAVPSEPGTGRSTTVAAPPDSAPSAVGHRTIAISVSSDALGLAARLTSRPAGSDEPFGDFATCSRFVGVIGPFFVGVGHRDGAVRWASIATAERVDRGGVYDADVRVEFERGDAVNAVGSVTLQDGLDRGTFLAFTPGGVPVDGSFECSAEPPLPEPDRVDDVEAPVVEVVALLQRGAADRTVSVVTDASAARCDVGIDGLPLLVHVAEADGGNSVAEFELVADGRSAARMRLVVGATEYEFGQVEVTAPVTGPAGTVAGAFAGSTADGDSVEGAFSCS